MKTQIVYIVLSKEADLFLEELWVSVYSLRLYNPDVPVRVLTDDATKQRIHERPELDKLITEVIAMDFPADYTPRLRSRVIKTDVRRVITGPYLYIDTDTVICHSLEDIDHLDCDIAMIPDANAHFKQHPFYEGIVARVKNIFGEDISDNECYFNGGVMYVADNERTHKFFEKWHKNWEYSVFQKGVDTDQQALSVTDKQTGFIIKELPGIYNCQIALSVKHYHDAYILHFLHLKFIDDLSFSPFYDRSIYRDVKAAGRITDHADSLVRNAKGALDTTTTIIGKTQLYWLFSSTSQGLLKLTQRNKTWAKFFSWLGAQICRYYRGKEKLRKKFHKE